MYKYLRSVKNSYTAKQSMIIWTILADLDIDEDSNNEDLVPLANKNKEVTRDAFEKSLVHMEQNQVKPDFQKDSNRYKSKPNKS